MDKKTTSIAAWVTGAALAGVALPLAAMAVAWMLFDASDVRPGGLAYYLGVPASIRHATGTFDECRPARFRWKGQDGLSAPFAAVNYGSRLEPAEAIRKHIAALAPLACRWDAVRVDAEGSHHADGMLCAHPDVMEAEIGVEGTGVCREISIGFILND